MSWDRQTEAQQLKTQMRAVKEQLVHGVGPFSPFWRERLAALGTTAEASSSLAALAALPAVGERDLCPDGDPRAASSIVLQVDERGWALHAAGPRLRRALLGRLGRAARYRLVVEADTRPTTFVDAGLALSYPVASTRGDLDVITRAGARLFQVLGLDRSDVLVCGLPTARTAALQGLELAALGTGTPALFPGHGIDDLARALLLVPATVLALPTGSAARVLDDLDEAGAPLSTVRTVLLVGAPDAHDRQEVAEALVRVGLSARVLAVHVPEGHRLLWGECVPEGGLHTYPDLEVVHVIDPATGSQVTGEGELVLTQLGLRGSALLRWRTGDLVGGVTSGPCPHCGRSVPRLMALGRGTLVPWLALRGRAGRVDLRGVMAALAGRADVLDWRVVLGTSARDGAGELIVHVLVASGADDSDVAVGVAKDIRSAAGLLPTQVVVTDALPEGPMLAHGVLVRSR